MKQFNISDIGPAVELFSTTNAGNKEALYKATTGEYLIEVKSASDGDKVDITSPEDACLRAIELGFYKDAEAFYKTVEKAMWVQDPIVSRPKGLDPQDYFGSDFSSMRRRSLINFPAFNSCALIDRDGALRVFNLEAKHVPELFRSIDALLSDEAISDECVPLGNELAQECAVLMRKRPFNRGLVRTEYCQRTIDQGQCSLGIFGPASEAHGVGKNPGARQFIFSAFQWIKVSNIGHQIIARIFHQNF